MDTFINYMIVTVMSILALFLVFLMTVYPFALFAAAEATADCLEQGYPEAKTLIKFGPLGTQSYCIGYDGAVAPTVEKL